MTKKQAEILISRGYAIGEVVWFDANQSRMPFLGKDKPLVIVAKKLTPQDTIGFRKHNITAIIVEEGSPNSHVSILSRVMDIPAVVISQIEHEWDGKMAVVDGYEGWVVIDPSEKDLNDFRHNEVKCSKEKQTFASFIGKETMTKHGTTVKLFANITSLNDLESVLSNDAEGIGNFKTEFLYIDSEDYPSEDSQFEVYREIASKMNGKKVIIRSFDIGADKTPAYFNLPKEENPALGYRAIRICLDKQEIFMTQIRAILRASAYGNVSIMYPMIISEDEIIMVKQIVANVMQDLSKEGIPYNDCIEQGIMIETPASVIISKELARQVDFFSIGTNDLTQYMLAADRTNSKLNHIVNPYHPAILRSIEYVISNAHEEGIWVSISGELGADIAMTKSFIKYGVDSLTVTPNRILELRKKIGEIED